jgi:uncharacterized phiE125 gp8 family phage protein
VTSRTLLTEQHFRVVTPPVKEPISRAEAIDSARLASDTDTEALDLRIKAARAYVESRCGITIHETEYELVLDGWPCGPLELPRATPLLGISSVKYVDSDEVENTVAPDTYVADTRKQPGRITLAFGQSWPSAALSPASPIRVTYRAGIASSPETECDADLKMACLLIFGALWENREQEVVSDANVAQAVLRFGIDALLNRFVARHVF